MSTLILLATPSLGVAWCRFREQLSLAGKEGRRYGLWITLGALFIAAFAAGVWAFAPKEQDPYTSPATSAFRALGAPVPNYACDEGMLLGGSRIATLAGISPQSSDEQVASAVEASLKSTGLARIALNLKVSDRDGSLRVLTSGPSDSVTAAIAVDHGTPELNVGSTPGASADALAIVAVAFCG